MRMHFWKNRIKTTKTMNNKNTYHRGRRRLGVKVVSIPIIMIAAAAIMIVAAVTSTTTAAMVCLVQVLIFVIRTLDGNTHMQLDVLELPFCSSVLSVQAHWQPQVLATAGRYRQHACADSTQQQEQNKMQYT